MRREVRVGVLASGRGSNFEALLHAGEHVRVVCLGTDNADAPALQIAARHQIASCVVDETASRGRLQTKNEQALCDFLQQHEVDVVCLAGFMRIVRGPLLEHYPRAILNVHPSLLPSFPGLNGPRQALKHGVRVSGCTVHFVDAGIDTGPIILQATVPILDDDTVASLTTRIQKEEHRVYPQAVSLWASDRIRVENGRVSILPAATSSTVTPHKLAKEESS